jgi:hypothetical protein
MVKKVLLLVSFANDSGPHSCVPRKCISRAITEILGLCFVLCIYVTPIQQVVTRWSLCGASSRSLNRQLFQDRTPSPGVLARCHPSVRASQTRRGARSLNRAWSSVTDLSGCCLHPLTQQGTRCIPLHPFRAPGSQLYRDSPRANWSSSQHWFPGQQIVNILLT